MEKLYFKLIAISCFTLLFQCNQSPNTDKAEATDAQSKTDKQRNIESESSIYILDIDDSRVLWEGSKLIGGSHGGSVFFNKGTLNVQNNTVVGGTFEINMNKIMVTDIPAEDKNNARLKGHLENEDFFNVNDFPISTFEITSVENYTHQSDRAELDPEYSIKEPTHLVTGNLKVKNITKSITFPARINVTEQTLQAEANFNINRYDWNIDYGKTESIKNRIINPEINISLQIFAGKK